MVSRMIDVIGMGDDGWPGLPPAARDLVARADVIVGGRRHLDLLPPSGELAATHPQKRVSWPSPLAPVLRSFLDSLPGRVVVLASGDPLRSGIGTTLVRELGASAVRIHPGVSSDTFVRARMGWAAEDVDVVTLVGRAPQRLRPFAAPGARLVVLCSDGHGPAEVATLLCEWGFAAAQLTAWWHLGSAEEGSQRASAATWRGYVTPDLVVLCVAIPDTVDGVSSGPAPGRPDDAFEHDGLITKRDIRAAALARLRPTPHGVLWDLGAGSGAVGLEWALALPTTRVVSVEQHRERAARIERNADAWGVAHRVEVLRTSTFTAVRDERLPRPDAVFLGGGLADDVIEAALARLTPGGRAVAHAVTVESELLVLAAAERHGGELVRLAVEHLEPLGRFRSWRPTRAVVSWNWVKPADPVTREEGTSL